MEEPLFMFQLIIAVDVSEHRSIYNKLNAPCSGDFKGVKHLTLHFSPLRLMSKLYFWNSTLQLKILCSSPFKKRNVLSHVDFYIW